MGCTLRVGTDVGDALSVGGAVGVEVGDELMEGACEPGLGWALKVGEDVGCPLMDSNRHQPHNTLQNDQQ